MPRPVSERVAGTSDDQFLNFFANVKREKGVQDPPSDPGASWQRGSFRVERRGLSIENQKEKRTYGREKKIRFAV